MSDSAFEQLVISQLTTLAEGHKEIKAELVVGQMQAEQTHNIALKTLAQATETNGRVTALEGWKSQHTDVHLRDLSEEREAESYAAGAQSERARAKSILARIWGAIRTPVLTGLFAGVTTGVGWLVVQLSDIAPW